LLFLLTEHFLDDWKEPLFKQGVILVRHDQIANAIKSLLSQSRALKAEVSDIAGREAFHDVFLDAARSRHNLINHLVLAEIANVLSHTTRGHVRRVSEIDRAARVLALFWVLVLLFFVFSDWLVGQSPLDHLVDLFYGQAQARRLEPSVSIRRKELLIVESLVKVVASNYLTVFDLLTFDVDVVEEGLGHAAAFLCLVVIC